MVSEDWYRHITEELVDQEKVLLSIMAISSAYMLWGTYGFSSANAARFPRLTTAVVLVGSLLLLFRRFLPDRIESVLVQSTDVFEEDEEFSERQTEAEKRSAGDEEETETDDSGISTVDRPIHDSLFTALVVVGYGLLSFAIGIFLATPIFVVVYTVWFKRPWIQVGGLTVLSLLIAYGFFEVLGVRLDRGEIFFTNGILIVEGLLGGVL